MLALLLVIAVGGSAGADARDTSLAALKEAIASVNETYTYAIGEFTALADNPEATAEQLDAATTLLTKSIQATNAFATAQGSDFPLFIVPRKGDWKITNQFSPSSRNGQLDLVVNCSEVSVFSFYRSENLSYSVDGVDKGEVKAIDNKDRVYIELSKGQHTVSINNLSSTYTFSKVYAHAYPDVSVSLLEPGSLGTEVLYYVNKLQDVKSLKVKGEMNADDWAKIKMMTYLYKLDLSEAVITEIPKQQFYSHTFLYNVKLPEGLHTIGEATFMDSPLKTINFPSSLENIGNRAFNNTSLSEVDLSKTEIITLNYGAFSDCDGIKTIILPKNLVSLGDECFKYCFSMNCVVELPETLKTIGANAFNYSPVTIPHFPKSLTSIGSYAFSSCLRNASVVLTSPKLTIGSSAFSNCPNLKTVELPVCVSLLNSDYWFGSCPIETITLRSATMVKKNNGNSIVADNARAGITLIVPSYLVNTYKLDEYWYNFGEIKGFSTSEVTDWVINQPLTLNARDRFEGTPDITLSGNGSLKINGEASMTINNFDWSTNWSDPSTIKPTQMLSNCDNITIAGSCSHSISLKANTWYFLSMPFDFNVADVTCSGTALKAIRKYDGEHRAQALAGSNWVNCADDETVTAGTGFIIQVNKASTVTFKALDNESKQYVVSHTDFVKALEANESEVASNRGWNLVGNPYAAYYDIADINFTAPITIWDPDNKRYNAYSIIDDQIALKPCEAFFVQCPEEVSSISFPVQGRQLTSTISSSSKTRAQIAATQRGLIDLTLNGGDRTRIVYNAAADADFESTCDAPKFDSFDSDVAAIWTIGADGTRYAINELPESTVALGLYFPADGTYTIALDRNSYGDVMLTDNLTGTKTQLNNRDYTFTASAGTATDRFVISGNGQTTGIVDVNTSAANVSISAGSDAISVTGAEGIVSVFTVDGRCIYNAPVQGETVIPAAPGIYIVRVNNKAAKICVGL